MKDELLAFFGWLGVALGVGSAAILLFQILQIGWAPALAVPVAWIERVLDLAVLPIRPLAELALLVVNQLFQWHLQLYPHWKYVLAISAGTSAGILRGTSVFVNSKWLTEDDVYQWKGARTLLRLVLTIATLWTVFKYGTQTFSAYEESYSGIDSQVLLFPIRFLTGLEGMGLFLVAAGLGLMLPLVIFLILGCFRRVRDELSSPMRSLFLKAGAAVASVPIGVVLLMATNAGFRFVPGM